MQEALISMFRYVARSYIPKIVGKQTIEYGKQLFAILKLGDLKRAYNAVIRMIVCATLLSER